jgi:hypothetical protein
MSTSGGELSSTVLEQNIGTGLVYAHEKTCFGKQVSFAAF